MADGGDGAAQGHDLGSEHFLKGFSDPEVVARYAEGPRRYVPGFESLHRMTAILLAERAPKDARVLVLGAGGAARSVVSALGRAGASEIVVINRSAERLGPVVALAPQARAGTDLAAEVAAADLIEWFADEGLRVYGRLVPSRGKPASLPRKGPI